MKTEAAAPAATPLLALVSVSIPKQVATSASGAKPPGTLYTMTARETNDDN